MKNLITGVVCGLAGTVVGAGAVYLFKKEIDDKRNLASDDFIEELNEICHEAETAGVIGNTEFSDSLNSVIKSYANLMSATNTKEFADLMCKYKADVENAYNTIEESYNPTDTDIDDENKEEEKHDDDFGTDNSDSGLPDSEEYCEVLSESTTDDKQHVQEDESEFHESTEQTQGVVQQEDQIISESDEVDQDSGKEDWNPDIIIDKLVKKFGDSLKTDLSNMAYMLAEEDDQVIRDKFIAKLENMETYQGSMTEGNLAVREIIHKYYTAVMPDVYTEE